MPSLIRRLFGKSDRHAPDAWRGWEGPFHVGCVAPRPRRLHDQVFVSEDERAEHDRRAYVLRGLTTLHLLGGEDHILVSDELRDVLARCCPGRLELLRAEVLDAPTGKRLSGYSELRPHEEITREEIFQVKDQTPRVWRYRASHLFVTKPVMYAVQDARVLGLHFLPGLSAFFGVAAAG